LRHNLHVQIYKYNYHVLISTIKYHLLFKTLSPDNKHKITLKNNKTMPRLLYPTKNIQIGRLLDYLYLIQIAIQNTNFDLPDNHTYMGKN
jgi:hypothetical protein